jgi:hypothetical protein
MTRVHPQRRSEPMTPVRHPSGPAPRVPAAVLTLAAVLAGVMACGFLALPAGAQNLAARAATQRHKAKPLKTLPTVSTVKHPPTAANGQSSPYARAAAQRADSGLPPPGHAHVLQRTPPEAASRPAAH